MRYGNSGVGICDHGLYGIGVGVALSTSSKNVESRLGGNPSQFNIVFVWVRKAGVAGCRRSRHRLVKLILSCCIGSEIVLQERTHSLF